MKIVDLRLGMLRAPLRTPFKTALRTVNAVEDLVVMLHADDGRIGYGSAPATAVITGDTHGSMREAIARYIAPRVIGQDIADLRHLLGGIQGAIERNGNAKAAVEIAVHDLWAQHYDAPLYRLLGGGIPVIRTDLTISVDTIETMVADALTAIDRGFDALKIKVGKDIDVDIERVRAIHDAVGDRASLRLDANQGWSAKEAVRALHALENAGVRLDLVEQPVKAHDIDGLRYVTERVATPVMADESVFGPREALALIQRRAADIINIKLTKSGGLSNALRIADLAALHGVECMIGCMLESSIGVAAAAHLAVARADVITRVDLDAPSLCVDDPIDGGTRFDASTITLSDAPGLGIRRIHGLEAL